jgi:WD40 repeat protein
MALRMSDKSIALWNATTHQASGTLSTNTLETDPSWPRSMALSRNGDVLIGPADTGHAIAVWDLPKRQLKQILPVFHGHGAIASLAISPDGSRAAVGGTGSGNIFVWDLRR